MTKPFIAHIDPNRTNFARSEIKESEASAHAELSLEEIFAGCDRCIELSGELQCWSDITAEVIKAALPLRHYAAIHPEAFDVLRKRPIMQDRQRAVSKKKPNLTCIYACRPAPTPNERKKCSKLAKILGKAVDDKVMPDGVGEWLKTVTQKEIVEGEAKRKPSAKFAVRLSRDAYPMLAAAVADDAKLSSQPELRAILEGAAARSEEVLRQVMEPQSSVS